jgi:hypothetical protein
MRPIQQNLYFVEEDDAGIASAQTPAENGSLSLDGPLATAGTVTLPIAAPVTLTSTDDFSGVTFTIIGTDQNNLPISEAVTGPNNETVTSTLSFKTITEIATDAPSGLSSETVSAGVPDVGLGAGAWWPLDIYTPNQVTNISATIVSGTAGYTVEYTNEDPFDLNITQQAVNHPDANLVGASTDQTGFTTTLMRAVRFNIASGTGHIRATVVQQSTQ